MSIDNHSNDYLDIASLTTAHLDVVDWLNYEIDSHCSKDSRRSPVLTSAELRSWLKINEIEHRNSFSHQQNYTDDYLFMEQPIQTSATQQSSKSFKKLLAESKNNKTPKKSKLQALDNFLMLTSAYIDDSKKSIYTVFPCLLRKLIEICGECTHWSWAAIYFRSLIRLVAQSKNYAVIINSPHLSASGSERLHSSAPVNSTISFSSSSVFGDSFINQPHLRNTRFNKFHESKHHFQSYRTSFLISLTCYLACKMAEFNASEEPNMKNIFVYDIIPSLIELSSFQKDVCDTPGIALMYIFMRVDIPIQSILFKYQQATLNSTEVKRQKLDGDNSQICTSSDLAFDRDNKDDGIPDASYEEVKNASSENPRTIYSLIHPSDKMGHESLDKDGSTVLKILQVFWIRCLAMGYFRRASLRKPRTASSTPLSPTFTEVLSASTCFSCSDIPENNGYKMDEENDQEATSMAEKDRYFFSIYKKLIVDSYNKESNKTVKTLYKSVFNICEMEKAKNSDLHSFPISNSVIPEAIDRTKMAGRLMFYDNNKLFVKDYSFQAVSSVSIELLRLIQNSFDRLLPKHVHLNLFFLSVFKLPATAPASANSTFYSKDKNNKRFSTLGRSFFTLKQIFSSTSPASADSVKLILDRFIFYMPEALFEGITKEKE